MLRWIEKTLSLRPGDLTPGVLLFCYYFLIISSYVTGQIARDALFLDRFEPDQLPYADIALALAVGVVIAGYIRAAQRVDLKGLLAGSLVCFVATALFLWWAFVRFRWTWLFPALYIWVGVFGGLAIAQVWTLANFVLTTRGAKRVFGLVGSGGIIGGIFGGFFSSVLVERFGTESLLVAVAVMIGGCIPLILRMTAAGWVEGTTEDHSSGRDHGTPRSLSESFRIVSSSSHLRSIAILITVTSIVTTTASWQFKAIAKQHWIETDALASFLGSFQGFSAILALVAQLVLTSRILQRFGVGVALFVLPVTLAFGSVGVLAFGGIYAATLLKGSDKVLRYSLDTAALQLLYLPVPTRIKVQVKSFLDAVVLRLGDGLAGLTLLVLVTYLGLGPREVAWVSLAFLAVWLVVARQARQEYLSTLAKGLRQHKIDAEAAVAPVLDLSTKSVMAEKLKSTDPEEILYGLQLFEMGFHETTHPAMRGLLDHDSPEVRTRVVALLNAAGDTSVLDDVTRLVDDDDLGVRTEALLYLTRHSEIDPIDRIRDIAEFSDATIRCSVAAYLARQGEAQNLEAARLMLNGMLDEGEAREVRTEAARLIGQMPDAFEAELARVVRSHDAELARIAIEGSDRIRNRRIVPDLISWLGHPLCGDPASAALAAYGDPILGTLGDYINDPTTPLHVRREIPAVLAAIGTPRAQQIIIESLFQGDGTVRLRLLSALNKIQKDHPGIGVDRQLVETVLAAEIMGHYRSYQALDALGSGLDQNDTGIRALRESMDREVEHIFRLLKVLHPEHDFRAANLALVSERQRVRDNSIEFLESALRPELRSLLLPLLDPGVSVRERVRLARQHVGAEVSTAADAVRMLIHTGDPWLRSCAAYAIGALNLRSLEDELDSMRADEDPLLQEAVRQAQVRLQEGG